MRGRKVSVALEHDILQEIRQLCQRDISDTSNDLFAGLSYEEIKRIATNIRNGTTTGETKYLDDPRTRNLMFSHCWISKFIRRHRPRNIMDNQQSIDNEDEID